MKKLRCQTMSFMRLAPGINALMPGAQRRHMTKSLDTYTPTKKCKQLSQMSARGTNGNSLAKLNFTMSSQIEKSFCYPELVA